MQLDKNTFMALDRIMTRIAREINAMTDDKCIKELYRDFQKVDVYLTEERKRLGIKGKSSPKYY